MSPCGLIFDGLGWLAFTLGELGGVVLDKITGHDYEAFDAAVRQARIDQSEGD